MRTKQKVRLVCLIISFGLTGCGGNKVVVIESSSGTGKSLQEKKEVNEKETFLEEMVFQDTARNPFLRVEDGQEEIMVEERELLENLDLKAIFYLPEKSYAIINGQIIKERNIVDNKEVVKISRDNIILRDSQGKEYLVKLGRIDRQ